MKKLLPVCLVLVALQPGYAESKYTELSYSKLKLAPEDYRNKKVTYTAQYHRTETTFLPYMESSGMSVKKHLWLVVADGGFDDRAELAILLFLETHIARIDAVFVERLGAGRMIGQKLVADIVKVADDRHVDIHLKKPVFDVRYGRSSFVAIYRDPHNFRSGPR